MGLWKNKIETAALVILSAGLCFIFLNRHIAWIVRLFLPERMQRDMILHPGSHPLTGFKVTLTVLGWAFFTVGTYVLVYQNLKRKSKGS